MRRRIQSENYKIDFLREILLFSSLSDSELSAVSSKVILKEVRKGEIILAEEDTNFFMYVIIFGQVKVVKTTEDGKDAIVAMHREGEFFGEMSLIDGKTAPATVVSTEDGLVGIISKKDFYDILRMQNKILDGFLLMLSSRLRESWDRIQMLNFKYASQRIRTIFQMLADKYGKETEEGFILKVSLTHQEIADMTGLTRETATRVLDNWQKDGDVELLRKKKGIRLSSNFFKKTD